QRIEFPPVADSDGQWYAFEMGLIDVNPPTDGTRHVVSLMASHDNPLHGGKLWIGGGRQAGSLFLRAEGGTPYERFRIRVEPSLPGVLHDRPLQAAAALIYLWAFVMVAHPILFVNAGTSESARSAALNIGAAPWKALLHVVILGAAMALFFLVPESPDSALPLFPELVLL